MSTDVLALPSRIPSKASLFLCSNACVEGCKICLRGSSGLTCRIEGFEGPTHAIPRWIYVEPISAPNVLSSASVSSSHRRPGGRNGFGDLAKRNPFPRHHELRGKPARKLANKSSITSRDSLLIRELYPLHGVALLSGVRFSRGLLTK